MIGADAGLESRFLLSVGFRAFAVSVLAVRRRSRYKKVQEFIASLRVSQS